MKVNIEISDEQVRGLLCTALEGGANYWYSELDYKLAEGVTLDDFRKGGKHMLKDDYWHPAQLVPFVEGCAITVRDVEDDRGGIDYTIDREKLYKGLALMAEKSPEHFSDFLAENDDAITGDVFLQYVCFGEVIYG